MITAVDIDQELARPGRDQASVIQNLLLLAVSIGAYYATGLLSATWASVLTLVLVLLIHETGHWLGMRYFGYRDVKMFFIPFFGAAVTGRSGQASAVRRAIVSLLGPAPGILLAVLIWVIDLWARNPLLSHFAVTAVILNVFNLLPLYPLDGGQFFQALVFSRHPFVDVAFKGLAALAMGAIAFWLSSFRLGFLALLTLGMAIESFSQAKILRKLRADTRDHVLPEVERIPLEYIELALPHLTIGLKSDRPKVKVLANRAQSVWILASRKAPRWGPTSALLGLYFGLLLIGTVGGALIITSNKSINQKYTLVHHTSAAGKDVIAEDIYYNQHLISDTQLDSLGLYDGPATTWNSKGLKQQEGVWKEGLRQGEWRFFKTDGSFDALVTYENGRPLSYRVMKGDQYNLVTIPPADWPFSPWLITERVPKRTRLTLP